MKLLGLRELADDGSAMEMEEELLIKDFVGVKKKQQKSVGVIAVSRGAQQRLEKFVKQLVNYVLEG
eukprot:2426661-Heterocapsa_arctica.AAC.1